MKINYKNNYSFSQNDVLILKGLAILLIVSHNYFHWQNGLAIENEFFYTSGNFEKYLLGIQQGLGDFLRYTLAYFGHFGVPIFIFLSGYGLYQERKSKVNNKFIFYFLEKIKKLGLLLLIGMLFSYLIKYINHELEIYPIIFLEDFLLIMTTQANWQMSTMFIVSGPFWFFGLMVQLYALFPLVAWVIDKTSARWQWVWMLFFLLSAAYAHPIGLEHQYAVMGNFLGNLPVFIFGIFSVKYAFKISLPLLLSGISLFIGAQWIDWAFTFLALIFTYVFLSFYVFFKKITSINKRNFCGLGWVFKKVGAASMAIFIINGPLRTLSIFNNGTPYPVTENFLIFLLMLLAISFPVAQLYRWLRRWGAHSVHNPVCRCAVCSSF